MNPSVLVPLIIAASIIVLAAIFLIIIFAIRGQRTKKGVNNGVWLIALGDKENIKEVKATGSRLSLVLVDKERIDREKLKELGVSSVLVMSNKVTLVIEGKAEEIASSIQKSL